MSLLTPWTILTGAAIVAIAASGLIPGGADDDSALPGPISLQDGAPVAAEDSGQSRDSFEVIPNAVIEAGNSDDSPGQAAATASETDDDISGQAAATASEADDDSPDQAPAIASDSSDDDSPGQAPPPAPGTASDESSDDGLADSPDDDPD
jgi:hypothetical protein